ncbi:hypothetical protein, partial [Niallia circulans]
MPFCGNPSNFGGDLELLARNTETRAKLNEEILGYQPFFSTYQPNLSTYQPFFRFISQTSDLSAKPQIYQP